MLAVVQRVREAKVVVAGHTIGEIGQGLLVLVCAERGDGEGQAERLLAKLLKLRIFSDEAGKMNRSVQDVGGGLLLVSQFTLAADTSSGNRPGFAGAARSTPIAEMCPVSSSTARRTSSGRSNPRRRNPASSSSRLTFSASSAA